MVLQTLAPKRYKPCHVEEFQGTVQQFCVKSETRDTLKFWRHETSLLLVNNRLEPIAAENVKTRNSCGEKSLKLEAFWKFQLWHSNYDGSDDLITTSYLSFLLHRQNSWQNCFHLVNHAQRKILHLEE